MKKIVRLLTKRRNHGFTLVEMIVSIALLAVLLGGMMIFISPILASYNDNQKLYTAENVSNCVQEYITHSLRNAYAVNIFTNASYDDNADAAVTDKVGQMVTYVNDKNKNTDNKNRSYELRCISLRAEGDKVYMYNEQIDTSKTLGTYLNGSKKVFSDVLYNNLYMEYEFSLPDENPDEAVEELSKDTFAYTIKAYGDKDKKKLVFIGTGLSELYAVRTMLTSGGKNSEYYINLIDLASASGGKDIYIYYIARKLVKKSST